jgi:hypothetical protein
MKFCGQIHIKWVFQEGVDSGQTLWSARLNVRSSGYKVPTIPTDIVPEISYSDNQQWSAERCNCISIHGGRVDGKNSQQAKRCIWKRPYETEPMLIAKSDELVGCEKSVYMRDGRASTGKKDMSYDRSSGNLRTFWSDLMPISLLLYLKMEAKVFFETVMPIVLYGVIFQKVETLTAEGTWNLTKIPFRSNVAESKGAYSNQLNDLIRWIILLSSKHYNEKRNIACMTSWITS